MGIIIGSRSEAEHIRNRVEDICIDLRKCQTADELLGQLRYHTRILEQKILDGKVRNAQLGQEIRRNIR